MFTSLVFLGLMGFLLMVIVVATVKTFADEYKYISKSYSISEYKKSSSRFFHDSTRSRFDKTSLPLDGGRTTFKESKSKSLMRYDFIRVNSIK